MRQTSLHRVMTPWRSSRRRTAVALETDGQSSNDALRRTHHEQLVVWRTVGGLLTKHVANSEQHGPLRIGEIQEWQWLMNTHVESCTKHRRARIVCNW